MTPREREKDHGRPVEKRHAGADRDKMGPRERALYDSTHPERTRTLSELRKVVELCADERVAAVDTKWILSVVADAIHLLEDR